MSIYKIIQELKSTRSRNKKEEILVREIDNEDLKNFFRLALNPFINFYQKKVFTQNGTGVGSLSIAMDHIEAAIAGRRITGNAAIVSIGVTIDTLSIDDAKVIMHILQKESGCDLGGATINKIWPKLIPSFPCLLATAYDDKLAAKLNWSAGVFSQLKSDGGRVTIVIDEEGSVSLFSRAGNELNVFGQFNFLGENFKGCVLDGELLSVLPNGKFAPRQISNGIFTKCVRDTLSEGESKTLHITTWDCIPLEDFKVGYSPLEYWFRWEQLTTKIVGVDVKRVSSIPTRIVHSIAQAQEHYNEVIALGEEGTMNKDRAMPWEDKRSKLQLKLKATETGDFKVVGYKDGVGKLTGNLGSLDIASSDDMVTANMSGFPLKLRSEIYANLTNASVEYTMIIEGEENIFIAVPGDSDIGIGSIIEAAYNQKIKGRDSDVWSIFLPRFKNSRPDKLVANSFLELK
jgi:DNA ligase 1